MLNWKRIANKRRRIEEAAKEAGDDDSDNGIMPFVLPMGGGKVNQTVYTHMNHVYFNDDITSESSFLLCRELRNAELQQKVVATSFNTKPTPIYLHLTTNGGEIHAAFAVVDTISQLSVPVYTVVDGFVASAGTLISLAGEKRFISRNAYMLLHELRSGVWGKMSSIEEEMENLKKIMEHITSYYMSKTKLNRKNLEKLLTKDVIWNADECVSKGVVDGVYA
jgi:ATP-dependent protease ClpP protease subunit